MTQITYDREIHKQVFRKLSHSPHYFINVGVLVGDSILLCVGFWLLSAGSIGAYLLAQILFVLVMFHSFCILHECGHGSCSSNRLINNVTGLYASIFCLMPYYSWKYIHHKHHSFAGNVDKDPTLKLIREYKESAKIKNVFVRVAWYFWIPLLAFFQHFVLWSYPFTLYQEGQLTQKRLFRCIGSILVPLSAYAWCHFLFPTIFTLKNFLPSIVCYLLVVELVNFPHHMDTEFFHESETKKKLPLWEQWKVTRSCYYPKWLSELFLLNFNFHIEHHTFPKLPWFRLREAHDLLKVRIGENYRESFGIDWSLQNRQKDPAHVFLSNTTKEGVAK